MLEKLSIFQRPVSPQPVPYVSFSVDLRGVKSVFWHCHSCKNHV